MAERQAQRTDEFGPAAITSRPRVATERREAGMHVCPDCDSRLVYPVDWAPVDRRRWTVALRCPDCEWYSEGVHGQEAVDRFDEVLDLGTEQLLDDLSLLTRANMEEQLERFVAALGSDLILPEDF